MGEVAHQAREKVEEWAGDAKEAVQHAGEKAQKWAGDAKGAAEDAVGDFGREVSSLVRKHPLPALLIGFGVGLLVGRGSHGLSRLTTLFNLPQASPSRQFFLNSQPFLEITMLRWAIVFLVIALLSAALRLHRRGGTSMFAAKILFFVFLVMFVVSLIAGTRSRKT